jgi:hypothetical protein
MRARSLHGNPDLYKRAEENLVQRAALPVKGLDVKSMLGDKAGDETLKAKPKVPPKPKAKAEAGAVLSAARVISANDSSIITNITNAKSRRSLNSASFGEPFKMLLRCPSGTV